MRAVSSFASVAFSALLPGLWAVVPAPVAAASGGGAPDAGWLARYAGRHADTIVVGRLIGEDDDRNLHFTILEVYRGEAASPIVNGWPE
jgi:hypothetical protein